MRPVVPGHFTKLPAARNRAFGKIPDAANPIGHPDPPAFSTSEESAAATIAACDD
jgi:hypothetical protein